MLLLTQVRARVILFWLSLALLTLSCSRADDEPIPGSEEAPIQLSPGGMTYEPSDGGTTVQPSDFGTIEPTDND